MMVERTCLLKLKMIMYFCFRYNEIWNKIKKTLNIKFHSQPMHDEEYMKTKVKTFNNLNNTVFSDNEIAKERNHCTCIAAINIDSVMKTDTKKLSSSLSRTVQI